MSSQPIYLSIDFEDFSFDKRRDLGLNSCLRIRVDALQRSIDVIEDICERDLNGARMTFFCTGILADRCPEVIRRISDLGHEIGCHYYYETDVRADAPAFFAERLKQAQNSLQDASGQAVRGFRAPQLSLPADDIEKYRIVEQLFDYDSSMPANDLTELQQRVAFLGLTTLRVFPVGQHKLRPFLPFNKTGGTHFKVLPASVGLSLLHRSASGGLLPMLYLHPYELVSDQSFMLRWRDLAGLPTLPRLKFALRQPQWHKIGNKRIGAKLTSVFDAFTHAGLRSGLLSANYEQAAMARVAE